MTSLRASYPVLKDRFSNFVKLPFGTESFYNQPSGIMQAGGYMFIADEAWLYASEDGINFLPIRPLSGAKIVSAAYGGGKFVFIGEGIWTSDGPDEYFNWNLQAQTPGGSNPVELMDVTFDGTAFLAVGQDQTTDLPCIQRALPADVSAWSAIAIGSGLPGDVLNGTFFKVRSGGGVLVAVGQATQDTTYDIYDVIQRSTDNGSTWSNVTPPGTQPPGETVGLTELEYVVDRFLALSSEEIGEGPVVRLIQSVAGDSWESIADRLVTPLFMQQQPDPAERYNRCALLNDSGRVLCLLPGFEMQIGKMGSTGPVDFERVSFPMFSQGGEKGMLLFKGNYYLLIEVDEANLPAYAIAFTPRVPVVG